MTYHHRIYGKTKNISIEEIKEKLKEPLFEYIDIALLFGSRASGKNKNNSDYDFAVLTKKIEYPWGVMSKVYNDIGDALDLPEYDYDVVDLSSANSAILDSIKKKYILLKGDDDELQRLFEQYNKHSN